MTSIIRDKSTWGSCGVKPSYFFIYYDFYAHDNTMSQRIYPFNNHVLAYFRPQLDDHDFNCTNIVPFQRQLYQCVISAMIWIKSSIE